jgi:hypothetical protein
MPSIFTIPKSFSDPQINIIQRNAIKSWIYFFPKSKIFLIGDDAGVAEVAKEFEIQHLPSVKKNNFGTPLLNSAFDLARQATQSEILIYANCDIVFLNDFTGIFKNLPLDKEFLAAGRRWDLDIKQLLNFSDNQWGALLKKEIEKNGHLHSEAGIDYFIFKKESFKNLPAFAVGRVGWDNWMIYEARNKKMPVIDITQATMVIHQNHDYPAFNKGVERKQNPEAKQNISLAQDGHQAMNLNNATHKLTKKGLQKKYFFWWPSLKNQLKRCLPQ